MTHPEELVMVFSDKTVANGEHVRNVVKGVFDAEYTALPLRDHPEAASKSVIRGLGGLIVVSNDPFPMPKRHLEKQKRHEVTIGELMFAAIRRFNLPVALVTENKIEVPGDITFIPAESPDAELAGLITEWLKGPHTEYISDYAEPAPRQLQA
ncbi:MAG TPA: hypothetical protein VK534_00075 [Methylomirabilota bacterium]|nr:hypothetical protein [Methylomirabilota bacterium]